MIKQLEAKVDTKIAQVDTKIAQVDTKITKMEKHLEEIKNLLVEAANTPRTTVTERQIINESALQNRLQTSRAGDGGEDFAGWVL